MKQFRLIAFALCLLLGSTLYAQNETFSIKAKFVDKSTNEAVGYATVALTKEGATSVYKYGQTDGDGAVTFKDIAKGKYEFKCTLLGYKDFTETIELSKDIDMGTKKMEVNAEYLEGATVQDVGNPIIVKKDTIEHNVSMMKISETDVLEDLLKRLPGVEVSSDGSITANGKTISKIQIDGREFFANDPQMATKNLPANIVEKVRVVEKKSDQAIFTGIDDGQEVTVLDLGIKGGMMNGLMGNVLAGAGHDIHDADEFEIDDELTNDLRYQGNAMLAKFTESSQTALIGNANNGGRMGFGGRSIGAMGGGMGGSRGGGGGGSGITSSWMAGLNGGYTFKDDQELILDGSVNGSDRYATNKTRRMTFNPDGSSLDASESSVSTTESYGVSVSSRADFKVSDKTSFIFEPSFTYGWGTSTDGNEFTTHNGEAGTTGSYKINEGSSSALSDNSSISAGGRLMLRQRFSKAGRTLTANARYSYSDNATDTENYSETNSYLQPDQFGNQTKNVSIVDQHVEQRSNSNSLNATATYTEPLGKNFYAEANYTFNWSNSVSSKDSYNKNENGTFNRDTDRDDLYSSNIINNRITQTAGVNFRKQEEKYNFTIGVNVEPNKQVNTTDNVSVDTTLTLKVVNWSPQARVDFNITDYKVIRINYRGRSSQPSINQLMPVPDNTNPLRVTLGNMDLNSTFTHNMDVSYRVTNLKSFSSINLSVDGSYKPTSIVNASWHDAGGVQYTIPMYSDKGTYSTGGRIMYNTPIGTSKFSLMSNTNFNYSNSYSYAGDATNNNILEPYSYDKINDFTENKTQNISASENLRLTFRNTYLEVTVGGSTRYSQAFYSISEKNVPATWNNGINGNIVFKHDVINFSTDANYNFYSGYSTGYGDPTLVWNAEISKNIFKKTTTLSIKMYDILNQSRSISHTNTDNYWLDSSSNTLGRYFIISLSYRFGSFGGGRGNRGGMGGMRGGMGGMRGGMGGGFGGGMGGGRF